MAGAIGGLAIGQPVLGSFAGNAIGEVASSVVGAKSERDETTREAAEKFASALGLAEASVHSFRTMIEATGAPVAQVSQGLSILESTGAIGGNGSQAIAGQGKLALGLGEQFGPVDTTIAQTLASDPALYEASATLHAKGTLTSSNFHDIAKYELLEGNPSAYTAFQQASAADRYTDDAEFFNISQQRVKANESWSQSFNHFATGVLGHFGIHMEDEDPITDLNEKLEDRKKELDQKAHATSKNDAIDETNRGAANLELINAGIQVSRTIGEYRYAALGEETPVELARRLPALKTSLDKEATADQTKIDQDRGEIAKLPAGSQARSGFEEEIARLEDDKIEKPNLFYRSFVKQNYLDQISDASSQSSLAETRAQLEGRSASDIEQMVDRQSRYLTGMATAPHNPLTPQEAASIEESALKASYSAKIETQAQNLSIRDERIEQAGLGIAQAQISGGPEQVYQARGKEIADFQAKIQELSSELERGGLTVSDRIAKERELTSAREAEVKAADARDQGRFNDTFSLDATVEETAQVGLSRRITRSGNAGSGDKALAANLNELTDAQSHLDFDRRNSPGNLKRIADDEGRVAQVSESREQILDETNAYRPAAAVSRKMANDTANFQIAMLAPYLDGSPEANPITAGNGLLADVRQDMAGLKKNRADLIKAGKWRPDEDENTYVQQRNSDRLEIAHIEQQQRMGFLSMLPEMIAGAPGQGILSAVLPNAGEASYFNPNPFITGSRGPASRTATMDDSGHTAQPGGTTGAFLSSTGAASAFAALTSEIKRLNDNVAAGKLGGRSLLAPAPGNPGGYLDAYRVPGR